MDVNNLESFRPISNLDTISKMIERHGFDTLTRLWQQITESQGRTGPPGYREMSRWAPARSIFLGPWGLYDAQWASPHTYLLISENKL